MPSSAFLAGVPEGLLAEIEREGLLLHPLTRPVFFGAQVVRARLVWRKRSTGASMVLTVLMPRHSVAVHAGDG